MGLQADMVSRKAGFFPRGGGEIALRLTGGRLDTPLDLTERGTSAKPAGHRDHLATARTCRLRAEDMLRKELKGFGVPVQVEKRDLPRKGAGAAVVLVAECQNGRGGWTALGERGKPMEKVASDAIRDFRDWQAGSAGVDEHLADQLVLPCALWQAKAAGQRRLSRITCGPCCLSRSSFCLSNTLWRRTSDGAGLVTLRGVNNRH